MKHIAKLFNTSSLRSLETVVLIGLLLYFGQALFIPLSFALLISFILYPICNWLEAHRFSRSAAIAVGLTILILLVIAIVSLLVQQFFQFENEWPALSEKLKTALHQLSLFITDRFNISNAKQHIWFENFIEKTIAFLGITLYNSSTSIVLSLLIPVYSALILYYRRMLGDVFIGFFPRHNAETVILILHKTIHTYYDFIIGMLIVYLVVGILNSLGLLLMGLPHAVLFGFVASILTIIPYVGIIIASLLPIAIAWLTNDSIWYPVGVVVLFTLVQYLEANIIFPLAVSNRLKINALVTIIVMIAGGILWGAAGMVLFIPFAAIAKLVSDQINPKGPISILMGP
jgi:predicted PurR-regulated permease PerM